MTSNGGGDGFVAKVNAAGTGLDYAGYIGGSGYDLAHGVGVDSAGNAYVAGATSSTEATFRLANPSKCAGSDSAFSTARGQPSVDSAGQSTTNSIRNTVPAMIRKRA